MPALPIWAYVVLGIAALVLLVVMWNVFGLAGILTILVGAALGASLMGWLGRFWAPLGTIGPLLGAILGAILFLIVQGAISNVQNAIGGGTGRGVNINVPNPFTPPTPTAIPQDCILWVCHDRPTPIPTPAPPTSVPVPTPAGCDTYGPFGIAIGCNRPTATPVPPTATATDTPTATATITPTPTITATPTNTRTPVPTRTRTPTITPTSTVTSTPTNTRTPAPTQTTEVIPYGSTPTR